MTAATFDHQVGKSLEFFQQQRNEKTACARWDFAADTAVATGYAKGKEDVVAL